MLSHLANLNCRMSLISLTVFFYRMVRHELFHGADGISGFPHCQKHFTPGMGWNMGLGKTAPRLPAARGGWSCRHSRAPSPRRRRGRRGGRGRGGFGHINGGVESHAAVVGRATVPGGRMAFGDGAGGFDSYSSSFSSSSSFRGKIEDEEEKD